MACAVLPLLLLVACSEGDPPLTETAGDVLPVEAASIEIVGTSDALAVVRDLEVLEDGSVWVLNSIEPFFVGFPSDGSSPMAWGPEGEGPEEFRAPVALAPGVPGEAPWAFDVRRHSLIQVNGPEGPWRELRLPREIVRQGSLVSLSFLSDDRYRLDRAGTRIIFDTSEGSEGPVEMWRAEVIAADPATGAVERVLDLEALLEGRAEAYGLAETFLPFPIRASCANGLQAIYDPTGNRVRLLTLQGAEQGSIPLPEPRLVEVTTERLVQAVFLSAWAEMEAGGVEGIDSAAVHAGLEEAIREEAGDLAGVFPEFAELGCADDGSVWMQLFDLDTGMLGSGPRWLRVDPTGASVEIVLPEEFEPWSFAAEWIWGVVRDEYDVPSVARVRWATGVPDA